MIGNRHSLCNPIYDYKEVYSKRIIIYIHILFCIFVFVLFLFFLLFFFVEHLYLSPGSGEWTTTPFVTTVNKLLVKLSLCAN